MYFVEHKQHKDECNTDDQNSWYNVAIKVVFWLSRAEKWRENGKTEIWIYSKDNIGYGCQQNHHYYFSDVDFLGTAWLLKLTHL